MRRGLTRKFLVIMPILVFSLTANAYVQNDESSEQGTGNPQFDAVMHGQVYSKYLDQAASYTNECANKAAESGELILASQFKQLEMDLDMFSANMQNHVIKIVFNNTNKKKLTANLIRLDTYELPKLMTRFASLNVLPPKLEAAMGKIREHQRKLIYLVDNFLFATSTNGNTWVCNAYQVGTSAFPKFSHTGANREIAGLKALNRCQYAVNARCKVSGCQVVAY